MKELVFYNIFQWITCNSSIGYVPAFVTYITNYIVSALLLRHYKILTHFG